MVPSHHDIVAHLSVTVDFPPHGFPYLEYFSLLSLLDQNHPGSAEPLSDGLLDRYKPPTLEKLDALVGSKALR